MFFTISSFRVDETPTPFFTNLNVSLFPEIFFVDDSSFNLSQSTASPGESSPAMEPTDSSIVIPSSSSVSPPPLLRRSPHVSQPFVLLWDYVCNSTIVTYKPHTYRELISNSLWQKAMAKELHVLTNTHTWDLVDLPPNKCMDGCKCVYKIKTHADRFIDWYKAWLVANGFTQEYDSDYEETFAQQLLSPRCEVLLLLLLLNNGRCLRWMSRMHFVIRIY